jgi:hypothetical protein
MSRCYVSEQIAAHCNQDEELFDVCFYCEEAITEDDHSEEILIEGFGWNHVHNHCKRK